MATAPEATGAQAGAFVRKFRPQHAKEAGIKLVAFLCAAVSVLTTLGILYVLASQAITFFREVPPSEFFFGSQWNPLIEPRSFGVLPLITGTLLITVGAGAIAIPLGLMVGIYLSEYAHPRVRGVLKPILEILAGIPTVVYGYFALFFITPLLREAFPSVQVYNAASGAIVVGIMVLPLVTSLCEDALGAVPKALREAAHGLGATKLEATLRIVVPSALSGIMASFILALSRAVGETMAVTLAAGARPQLTFNPADSVQTMTAYIVGVTSGDVRQGSTAYNSVFAVGITLFAMTMVMNLLAIRLVRRFRSAY
ncbi:MAG: phosphate ABC transporter permease subunit PstC [Fimbriimonadaceae bacterium]|nr:phosphate ABC transporter permease subunit PstC [Chthonomonadaceae bacterium]MCO5296718.1 phosphate ABC transporter permease subunit PstC [Fimbriimonadaceae bacterium]